MTRPMPLDDPGWLEDAIDVIAALASRGRPFSSDDLRREMRPAPYPSKVGAAFQVARHRGLITCTGYRQSTAPTRRHSLIREWQKPKETP